MGPSLPISVGGMWPRQINTERCCNVVIQVLVNDITGVLIWTAAKVLDFGSCKLQIH